MGFCNKVAHGLAQLGAICQVSIFILVLYPVCIQDFGQRFGWITALI
jgi:hypothetical protein